MRAAVCRRARAPLDICDMPDPDCPEDGVVLKTLAAGVCRSDHHLWTGADPAPLPIIVGHEYCGEVIETGPLAKSWQVGDRVIAPFILACGRCPTCARGQQTICADQILPGFTTHGAWAEAIAVPRADTNLTRLPEGLDMGLAAGLGCRVTTAWQGLTERGGVAPGDWVAIHGTGGVGMAALLLARAIGARVVAVDVTEEKLRYAKSLGADLTVDARSGRAAEEIRDLTGGGAQVAIEALGRPETTRAALLSLAPLGRMVQIGMPSGDALDMSLPMGTLYSRQLSIHGTRGMPAWRYPSILSLIESGQVDLAPLIGARIALSGATEALKAMDGPTPPGISVITDFTQ